MILTVFQQQKYCYSKQKIQLCQFQCNHLNFINYIQFSKLKRIDIVFTEFKILSFLQVLELIKDLYIQKFLFRYQKTFIKKYSIEREFYQKFKPLLQLNRLIDFWNDDFYSFTEIVNFNSLFQTLFFLFLKILINFIMLWLILFSFF